MSIKPRLPGIGASRNPGDSARVRALVRTAIPDTDVTILVTELTCTEPGCPPTETVIALMHPGAPRQYKIHKPLVDVTASDISSAFAGDEHQH